MKVNRLLLKFLFLIGCAVFLYGCAHARQDVAPNAQKTVSQAGKQADMRRKGPYVIYKGKNTEMTLLWQGMESFKSRVRWGKDLAYSMGSAETVEYGDHQHRFNFKGLEPGTRYFYEVTMGEQPYTGSFHAAPSADQSKLKFLVYGDTRSNPRAHNQVAGAMLNLIDSQAQYQSLLIAVGDLVKFGDVEAQWEEQFFDSQYPKIQNLLSQVSFQSAVGNHELYGLNYRSVDKSFKRFKKYFPYPYASGAYWSFDYGPAHFVIADQYTDEFYDSDTHGIFSGDQLDWIEEDLAASKKPWKFIVLHEPGWSALGGHENNEAVQEEIQPLAEEYGVAVVFGGHNHYYARAIVNGVQHITAGGGGAPLRSPDKSAPNVVAAARAYHFCTVEIDGKTLRYAAIKPDGTVIDSFSIQR